MEHKKNVANSTQKSKAPLYYSIIFLAILVVLYFTVPAVNHFFNEAWQVLTSNNESRIKQWVANFGWWGPIVIVCSMVLQMFLLVIPTILLMVVSILAYGPIWGSILILIAVFCASTVGYFVGNYLGSASIAKLIGEKPITKISGFLDNYGFWAVVITRINPFLSNDAISFVAGLLKMNYWKFIASTLIGIAPLTLLIAVTGKNIDTLKNGLLWGSIVSLVFFIVYVWWDKQKKK